MNKQEAIKRVEQMGEYERFVDEPVSKKSVLNIISQIHEPKKVVVPKYVADWIEWCKKHKVTLLGSIIAVCNDKNIRPLDASGWASKNQETFTKAWFYGYEVEKEKLYTVEIPICNSPLGYHYVLRKTTSGEIIIDSFFTNNWVNYDYCQLTEEEIKKDHGWAWKYAKRWKNETLSSSWL